MPAIITALSITIKFDTSRTPGKRSLNFITETDSPILNKHPLNVKNIKLIPWQNTDYRTDISRDLGRRTTMNNARSQRSGCNFRTLGRKPVNGSSAERHGRNFRIVRACAAWRRSPISHACSACTQFRERRPGAREAASMLSLPQLTLYLAI